MFRSLFFSFMASATFLIAAPLPQSLRRPLVFEPNHGQEPAQVNWVASGPGYWLFLTDEGITMMVKDGVAAPTPSNPDPKYSTVHMKLTGSRSWKNVSGLDATGGTSNYFRGKAAKDNLTAIPHYGRVKVSSVYDGIDLVFYSNGGNLEYDFVVAPGADPGRIQLKFEGQKRVRVDAESGDLVLMTSGGSELRQVRPKVYQEAGNRRVEVGGGYQLLQDGRAVFSLGGYDSRRTLVIDPTVLFTVFLHGDAEDEANAVAVDNNANSYITGATYSGHFPTQKPIESSLHKCDPSTFGFCVTSSDAFVTKISPTGAILFSTYLGGSNHDEGSAITADLTGVYVAGFTSSGDFPDKLPEGTAVRLGGADLFVTKLSPDGQQLIYSSIDSGPGDEFANGIAVDSRHAVWVTGSTSSRKYLVGAPFHESYATVKGPTDVFYTKLGASGEWIFTGLAGGSGADSGAGVAIDPDDNPWFTGQTCSADFPASIGFNNYKGGCAVFAFALNNQTQIGTWRFGTVFGGSDAGDSGTAIAVDARRQAYVTGFTSCPFFPVETGGFQTVMPSAGSQAFVTKLDGFGHFIYSTYLGSDGDTFGRSIALNAADEVYVGGDTSSTSFPGAPPLTPNPTAGFVSKLPADLSTLLFTKLLGASVNGVAVFEIPPFVAPEIYTTGVRYVNGVTPQDRDAFVVKLNDN